LGDPDIVDAAGQTEIGDLDPLGPAVQENIGRLDVAMNQTVRMRRSQARRDLVADAQNLGGRQVAAVVNPLLQRLARDTFHHQIGQTLPFVHGVLAGYEDQNDHDILRADPVFKLRADRCPEEGEPMPAGAVAAARRRADASAHTYG
jgi:hypothetical protein